MTAYVSSYIELNMHIHTNAWATQIKLNDGSLVAIKRGDKWEVM